MPELPELEVFSSNLHKKLRGKKVEKVTVKDKRMLKVSPPALKKAIEGQIVKEVYRDGKELHIEFADGTVLGLHLMLHGQLYLFKEKSDHRFGILELLFSDGNGLALTDWQRAATPKLNPPKPDVPDALSAELDLAYLKEKLRSRSTIKSFLMNQDKIRGIGNAYADEILAVANINPRSISSKVPDEYIKALIKAIRKVLPHAVKQIKKANPSTISGEVRDFLKIHNEEAKTSPSGQKIISEKIGGRTTYYTAGQKLFV